MAEIVSCTDEFEEYLRDESRSVGSAESIVFPESEADVRDALHALHATGVPVTVQGRAFRLGGWRGSPWRLRAEHVAHEPRARHAPRLRRPLLCARATGPFAHGAARPMLQKASFDTAGWSDESLDALSQFKAAPAQFFAPDPTEASAALGGIVACNASARAATPMGRRARTSRRCAWRLPTAMFLPCAAARCSRPAASFALRPRAVASWC